MWVGAPEAYSHPFDGARPRCGSARAGLACHAPTNLRAVAREANVIDGRSHAVQRSRGRGAPARA